MMERRRKEAAHGDPSSEEALVQAFVAGGVEAAGRVRGWVDAVVHLGNWHFADPEDAVQEVLVKLCQIVRAGRYQRRSSFKTFVFSVAKHTCIDRYRRQRLASEVAVADHGAAEPTAGSPLPDVLLERKQRLQLLQYVFQQLPEKCRRLWRWVYADGLKAADVAERLGITPGHARVQLHRCLETARSIGRQFHGSPL